MQPLHQFGKQLSQSLSVQITRWEWPITGDYSAQQSVIVCSVVGFEKNIIDSGTHLLIAGLNLWPFQSVCLIIFRFFRTRQLTCWLGPHFAKETREKNKSEFINRPLSALPYYPFPFFLLWKVTVSSIGLSPLCINPVSLRLLLCSLLLPLIWMACIASCECV